MWSWVASALVLGVIFWILSSRFQRRKGRRRISLRRRYLQDLARMEQMVAELGHYGSLIANQKIAEPIILGTYESSLQRVETLLESVHQILSFEVQAELLDQLDPLITSCEKQMKRFRSDFRKHLPKADGVSVNFWDDWLARHQIPTNGCYFCSRPYLPKSFSQVKINHESGARRVWSCHVCKAELKAKGEVKVLYFRSPKGVQHWSELSDYSPVRHFSLVGEPSQWKPCPVLKLVKAEETPPADI